jgi:hypothetical protein
MIAMRRVSHASTRRRRTLHTKSNAWNSIERGGTSRPGEPGWDTWTCCASGAWWLVGGFGLVMGRRDGVAWRPGPRHSTAANGGQTYAVLPDGKGFLFASNAIQPEVRELKLVLNGFEDLTRRVRVP